MKTKKACLVIICALPLIFLFSLISLKAQMLADFETPGITPDFTADGSYDVVVNPDKLGINTSDSAGYYHKTGGKWSWIRLHYPDTMNIRHNNTLTFKVRSTRPGRVFAKFWLGSQVPIEGWAPDYSIRPSNTWVPCEMDLTPAMGKDFTRLDLAISVDDTIEADIWFDDVKLSNPDVGEGIPYVCFDISKHKTVPGEALLFDASESYDYYGEIIDYNWDFGDGISGSGETVQHIYSSDSVYKATLTVTDNDSISASLSRYILVIPEDGSFGTPMIVTGAPETNSKIEAIFNVNRNYENVYDPDEVCMDAVITYPDGDTVQLPCFYYIQTDYAHGQWQQDTCYQAWMARFISEQAGTHSLRLKLTDSTGITWSDDFPFEVAAGNSRGLIRADTINKQYYRHSTGEPFYPLGINIGWNSIENYTQIIHNLSAGKANIFRYWHAAFNRQALEWRENYYFYHGLGKYSQEAAAMTDSLLELCEAVDVFMQLSIFSHGMFSENVDKMWADNPYNIANGGYVERAEAYFYNHDCKVQTKKLLRYIVARWAWSKNLFAWEFFNEVQFTGIYPNQSGAWFPGVMQWHSEMSRYVDAIDPYDHLQTTSAAEDQLPVFDTVAKLDNLQYHLYTSESYLLEKQAELDHHFRAKLPFSSVINGEYGASNADVPFDIQRHAIWNGIMTQVPRYMWTWSHYLQPSWAGLFTMPAQYLADEDLSKETGLQDYGVVVSHPAKELKSYGMSNGNKYYGYIYDPDNEASISGTKIEFPDLPLACYDLALYLPLEEEIITHDSIVPFFSSNTVELPVFSKGLAFKLKYRSPYTAPLAVAGNDTVILAGGTATLNGELSWSQDSSPLTYRWRMVNKPDSSEFMLSDSSGMTIDVSPDVSGSYTFWLIVNDGQSDSRPDAVKVRVSTPPVAVAGNDTTVIPDKTYLRLSGKASYDPDGDLITYQWTLLSAPPGSDSILLGGQESGITSLKMDAEGIFVIQLIVSDGYQSSLPDTIVVTVLSTGVSARNTVRDFSVYPNPTEGIIYIHAPGRDIVQRVEVFDQQGRLFMQHKPGGSVDGTIEINLNKYLYTSGLVFIKITGSKHTEIQSLWYQSY
jgi:hypothetical protein